MCRIGRQKPTVIPDVTFEVGVRLQFNSREPLAKKNCYKNENTKDQANSYGTSYVQVFIPLGGYVIRYPRFPFMRAANLQFCELYVHFLAPKIHIFSTRRNDMLCPRCCVCVCVDKLPQTHMYVLYHNYTTKETHSPLLHRHFCH